MVGYRNHGGSCCGAGHLSGFGRDEENNPNLILNAQRQSPTRRMTEVILNGTQVAEKPATLRRLADMGYVLVGHYINGNHNSHNYVFHRMDARLPLVDPVTGACVIRDWDGPIITPGLTGNLAPLPQNAPANNENHFVRPLPVGRYRTADGNISGPTPNQRAFRRVDRVRVNSPTSARHNREFVVEEAYGGYVYMREDGTSFRIVEGNCINLTPREEEVVPAGRPIQVGSRVQYTGRGDRPIGSCGTVTYVTGNGARVRWDNPLDRHQGTSVPRQLLYVAGIEGDLPVIHPPALPQFVATRHEVAPDWEALQAARGLQRAPIPAPPAPAQPVAPRVVFSTWHNVFADGRKGAGYDTYALCHAARGRRNLIDKREILSDGTTRWINNVQE